jgi:hypothetical protein
MKKSLRESVNSLPQAYLFRDIAKLCITFFYSKGLPP